MRQPGHATRSARMVDPLPWRRGVACAGCAGYT